MAAPSRRRFLGLAMAGAGAIAVGGGAGALIGLRRDVAPDPIVAPRHPTELTAAILREQALLERYRAAGASTAGVSERVARIVGDHTQHLLVLAAEWARITDATSVVTSPAVPAESAPAAPRPAMTLQQELDALSALERTAATEYAAACLAGRSAPAADVALHVLLGSIGACEAVHEAMLR